MMTRATCGAVILATSMSAQADICRWTDVTGGVHYGDHAPHNAAAECNPAPAKKAATPQISPYQFDPEIVQIAEDIKRAQRANIPFLKAQERFAATLSRARWRKANPTQ